MARGLSFSERSDGLGFSSDLMNSRRKTYYASTARER